MVRKKKRRDSGKAHTRGTFKAVLTPRQGGGPDQHIERWHLEILRKQNGEWLITRTMDNATVKANPQIQT